MEIIWKPTVKQLQAWEILQDRKTTELFFGGGAGGGKSSLGCIWLITNCLRYPGSRWLMGRAILKHLKESTLLTFFNFCREFGFKAGEDYKYNSIEGVIRWYNESEIYLKDLFHYPSDPEFDSLGSTEFTGAFIDEGSQVSAKAKNIVMSRLRYKLEEFGIIPKLLICSNPTKNFLYYEFYKPWKEHKLEEYRAFIPALVGDNPFISPYYIENLKKLDKISKERLLYGNFEYDEDPTCLFEYEKILDIFTNSIKEGHPITCMTVDVARFGTDKTVIFIWRGFHIMKIVSAEKQSTQETRLAIEKFAAEFQIPRSNIVIDEDGIGGGIVDEMPGVRGFVNNSKPIESKNKKDIHNFANLKSQCYFMLAEKVNTGGIGCFPELAEQARTLIVEDLEQIKRKDPDKDGRIAVTPKEEIKEKLGRSTDFGDAMMMRMYFELKKGVTGYISI